MKLNYLCVKILFPVMVQNALLLKYNPRHNPPPPPPEKKDKNWVHEISFLV